MFITWYIYKREINEKQLLKQNITVLNIILYYSVL